eukprot:654315-Rhodomonas_salina.2
MAATAFRGRTRSEPVDSSAKRSKHAGSGPANAWHRLCLHFGMHASPLVWLTPMLEAIAPFLSKLFCCRHDGMRALHRMTVEGSGRGRVPPDLSVGHLIAKA